jgi:hypothetical protein
MKNQLHQELKTQAERYERLCERVKDITRQAPEILEVPNSLHLHLDMAALEIAKIRKHIDCLETGEGSPDLTKEERQDFRTFTNHYSPMEGRSYYKLVGNKEVAYIDPELQYPLEA